MPIRPVLGGLILLLGASGCSQCGSSPSGLPGPDASPTSAATGSASGTGAGAGPGSGCVSPAIVDPPACQLARASVKSPSLSPDGRTLLVAITSGAAAESVEVWDARKGTFVTALARGLEAHGGVETAWAPDGSRVAAAGVGDSHFGFRIFDTTSWKALHQDEDIRFRFPCALALDATGERVAVTTLLGTAAIHDLRSGKSAASLATNPQRAAGHVCSVLEWSGDGKAIQVEGLRLPEGLRPVPYRATATGLPGGKPVRDEDLVEMRLAPKGDVTAYLDRKGNVRLFTRQGTAPLKVLAAGKGVPASSEAESTPVRSLSWRLDGTALATWDRTGKVRVWDVAKGAVLRELRAGAKPFVGPADPETEATRLVWAPDGRSFAFRDGERAELWSLDDGAQKLAGGGAASPETAMLGRMLFSPDGALLAAGTALHDTKSGALVRTLPAAGAQWLDAGRFLLLAPERGDAEPLRILRISDGALLALHRLGDDASPVLLPRTADGVFEGPPDLAGCGRGIGRSPAPEPRDTLVADFWAGKPVARTCPASPDEK